MILFLPRNLALLSRVVSRSEHHQFSATTNIRVEAKPNGLYRAEAMDGRRAVIVQGPFDLAEQSYDWLPGDYVSDPGEAFVPREVWDQGFKLPDPQRQGRPIGLATTEGGFLVVGCEGSSFSFPREEPGRWPDVNMVLPRKPVLFSLRFDPNLLMDVLKVAAAIHGDSPWVELLYFGKGLPFALVTSNFQGQALDSLVVPLDSPKEEKKKGSCPPPSPTGEQA